MSTGLNILSWLFVRLPLAFSVPFTSLSLWWILGGFRLANDTFATPATRAFNACFEAFFPGTAIRTLIGGVADFIHAAVIIGLFAVGFLLAYNISALINWALLPLKYKLSPGAVGPPELPPAGSQHESPFRNTQRIGIVLAGGGAKGAYQAGAMKAIYEFLAKHDALDKVTSIAGTSIGSWNALFWLSSLIKPAGDWSGQSAHESWWSSISAKSLTAPSWYVPFFRNAFLSSAPWQRRFDEIFGRDDVTRQLRTSPVHFYFTRSNVESGTLECATNNPAPPRIPSVSYEQLDANGNVSDFLDGVKAGVFASMDLPPLFPFFRRDDRLFEDGGVIDNVPIVFPAMDGCDLIFVLPLNADFEKTPNNRSILARFLRVMDIRQGALERGGFKLLYLYNELAVLRQRAEDGGAKAKDANAVIGPLASAMNRHNQFINVFAICPLKSFVEQSVNTVELWKHREAGQVFNVMYKATADLLPTFKFEQQDSVRVALVSRTGNINWDGEF